MKLRRESLLVKGADGMKKTFTPQDWLKILGKEKLQAF